MTENHHISFHNGLAGAFAPPLPHEGGVKLQLAIDNQPVRAHDDFCRLG